MPPKRKAKLSKSQAPATQAVPSNHGMDWIMPWHTIVLTGHQGGLSNTHRQASTACAWCKSCKVKCKWLEEAQACHSCIKGGAQGTCATSRQEEAAMSTCQSVHSSSCKPSMVPHPLPANPVISKPRNLPSLKWQLEDEIIPQKPAKTQKHSRSALLSESYSSSMVPRTESSELVAIPEIDEESNNLLRPESTILADGTPLPLSISYKQVVDFLEHCNDDNMGQVGPERKGTDNHHDCDDIMDIDSDSDADDCKLGCDNSESNGMSMIAWKVPQWGHPKNAAGSKQLGSQSWDSWLPEDVQLHPDPETYGKLKLFLINLAHTGSRLCHPMQCGQYWRE